MKTTMKTISLLLTMTCLQAAPASSQRITEEQALEKATQFMRTVSTSGPSSPRFTLASDSKDYYIFNDEQNGGYVIVSSTQRRHDVLGYSPTGHFNAANVSCSMQALLESLGPLPTSPLGEEVIPPGGDKRGATPPLLDCSWGQGFPYFNFCPTLGGNHCITGCVATAVAQIMYHHKWPLQGKGQISYEWAGQTLSADFSQSHYRWDLMLPTYNEDSSQESQDAVALLLKDVGYAYQMIYDLYDSGTSFGGEPLLQYFDYDQSARFMEREFCSQDDWNAILEDELTNGRPVLLSGGSTGGAHTMVIDGSDGNGYFHFNFGWNGDGNGYFATSEINFNKYQMIVYGIKKNEGGKPLFAFACKDDFLYDSETRQLHLNDWIMPFGVKKTTTMFYIAMAVVNNLSDKTYYSEEYAGGYRDFDVTMNLPDGNYTVYPVARISPDDPWQRVLFRDNRQSFVDLNVTNGEKTFTNNHIFDGLQEGAVEIGGIYYFLDPDTHEASVTFKNDKYASYTGNVTIPAHVDYQGTQYIVTAIGTDAFMDSQLGVLTIPNTVRTLDTPFSFAQVERIVFQEGSSLQTFRGICFNAIGINDMEMNLPEGLTLLPSHIFQSSQMSWVSLPSTLATISGTPFNYSWNLRYIAVNNPTPIPLSPSFFTGIDLSLCTLYVPQGTAAAYAAAPTWKDFGHIREMGDTVTIDGVKYLLDPSTHEATVFNGYYVRQQAFTLPATITHGGTAYQVSAIGSFAFASGPVEELTIPATVSYFGEACFNNIYNDFHLQKLLLYHTSPPEVADMTLSAKEGFKPMLLEGYFKQVELHVPVGSKADYQRHSFWGRFANIVEDQSLDISSLTLQPSAHSPQPVYTLDGRKLQGEPKTKGVYIHQGKKVVK